MKKITLFVAILFTVTFQSFGQTQRNPVLEFCTGVHCVPCASADTIIHNTILPALPNAIILAYHGYYNDPFADFPGSTIMDTLDFYGSPTGIIDRVSGVQFRDVWFSQLNSRNSIPATVAISMTKSYDTISRDFNASIDFTALQTLNGQFKFNVFLLEDGIVWWQAGADSNYVHDWVVRSIMNGVLGQEVINGTWTQGQVINKTISYNYPVPPSPGPDIVPDNCSVVVLVYKVGSPLNSNAEIQQAIQDELISLNVSVSENVLHDAVAIQNYPNPFNDFTTLTYSLEKETQVKIVISDLSGRIVTNLLDEVQLAGDHTLKWDATNTMGNLVKSGIYFCTINMGTRISAIKLIVQR